MPMDMCTAATRGRLELIRKKMEKDADAGTELLVRWVRLGGGE
jgi:hypothetical protein